MALSTLMNIRAGRSAQFIKTKVCQDIQHLAVPAYHAAHVVGALPGALEHLFKGGGGCHQCGMQAWARLGSGRSRTEPCALSAELM